MKASSTGQSTTVSSRLISLIIALIPFHAFLTVWLSTFAGHYTALRLWDDALLVVLGCTTISWLVTDRELRKQLLTNSIVMRLITAYGVLTVCLTLVALSKHEVTLKAASYGLLTNLRFLIFFITAFSAAYRGGFAGRHLYRLVMIPAAVVAVFAVLQFTILPHNFLSHFGYDAATNIAPIETINNDSNYVRVQSTLRGANPLGAYLVMIVGVLVALWRTERRRLKLGLVSVLALAALFCSFSRSAWIGAVLTVVIAGGLQLGRRGRRIAAVGAVGVIIVFVGLAVVFRNNNTVDNTLYHTSDASQVAVSSNQAHASALKDGIDDVVAEPFGTGPGSAGPASVYNAGHDVRIADNYYIQIAQETGWAGLMIFLAIITTVGAGLYRLRKSSPLALGLLAALVGISFVCLLSHAWTDDTLAFIWWGLAGITIGKAASVKSRETDV